MSTALLLELLCFVAGGPDHMLGGYCPVAAATANPSAFVALAAMHRAMLKDAYALPRRLPQYTVHEGVRVHLRIALRVDRPGGLERKAVCDIASGPPDRREPQTLKSSAFLLQRVHVLFGAGQVYRAALRKSCRTVQFRGDLL